MLEVRCSFLRGVPTGRGVYGKIVRQFFLPVLMWLISQLLSTQESQRFLNLLQQHALLFTQCVHTDKFNFKNLAAINFIFIPQKSFNLAFLLSVQC